MASKLDMKKLMVDLNGTLLKNALLGLGFSENWINWIMECRTTTILSLLVNGIIANLFKSERGIRQGDTIFHIFLFFVLNTLVDVLISNVSKFGVRIKVAKYKSNNSSSHIC